MLGRGLGRGDAAPLTHGNEQLVGVLHQRRVTEGADGKAERFGARGRQQAGRLATGNQCREGPLAEFVGNDHVGLRARGNRFGQLVV